MNKYQYEAEQQGRVIDTSRPHTGQTRERLTRFTYDQGPMYYLGQQIVKAMQDSGYPAHIWQCYRPPEKQREYQMKGTSKAGPWESPHQFYEAVDILHPKLFWQVPEDYWEQLAACVRIVAERFDVELNHGHEWSWRDSAHIELEDWRTFREQIRARWREETNHWYEAREVDPLLTDPMPQPTPPNIWEREGRFFNVLPKVWTQHRGVADPSPPAEFVTRRQRQLAPDNRRKR